MGAVSLVVGSASSLWRLPTTGLPKCIRQVGQLSATQPDFGVPHTAHRCSLVLIKRVSADSSRNPSRCYNFSFRFNSDFLIAAFGFVSDFGIRISDLSVVDVETTMLSESPSLAQCSEEKAHLFIHFLRRSHCLRDFAAQQSPITLSQTMNGYPRRPFSHRQALANPCISPSVALP